MQNEQVLEAYLQTHYATPQAKNVAAVYRLYREKCGQEGIPPVSERTFYRVRARFTTNEVEAKRRGSRAAYASAPFAWLDQTTPRHGERPFALAHIDLVATVTVNQEQVAEQAFRNACWIVGTNVLEPAVLSDQQLIATYK